MAAPAPGAPTAAPTRAPVPAPTAAPPIVPFSRVVRGSPEQAERASEAASSNPSVAENNPEETFLAFIKTPPANTEQVPLMNKARCLPDKSKRQISLSAVRQEEITMR